MLIGILIIAFPLLLILLAADVKTALYKVALAIISFHVFLALVTQAIGIFNRPVLLGVLISVDILTLAALIIKRERALHWYVVFWTGLRAQGLKARFKRFKFKYVFVLFMMCLIFFQLYSVHFNYSGAMVTIQGPEQVSHMSSSYPYFSDEWVAASYANNAISTGHLVLKNPLSQSSSVVNFLMPYFAFISELFLVFGLNPVSQFAELWLIGSLLLLAAMYTCMREQGISAVVSIVTIFLIMFITNGANIPGLWYLLPLTAGVGVYFLGLTLEARYKMGKRSLMPYALGAHALSFLLYPPMIIFILPTLVVFLWSEGRKGSGESVIPTKQTISSIWVIQKMVRIVLPFFVLAAVLIFAFALLFKGVSYQLALTALSTIFFRDVTGGLFPHLTIFNMLPVFILPFSIAALVYLYFKRNLIVLVPTCVGLLLWIFTALSKQEFVISYARTVMVTSYLLVIGAAFILEYIYTRLFNTTAEKGSSEVLFLKVFVVTVLCGLSLFLAFSYTSLDRWNEATGQVVAINGSAIDQSDLQVSPPVNKYLSPEDVRLFSKLKNVRFEAPVWKGLVVDVATGNFALETKAATFLVNILPYNVFNAASCDRKMDLAHTYHVQYFYSTEVSCEGLNLVGTTTEGMVLYKINPKP